MKLPLLKDVQVAGKRVLLRSDLDVPLMQPSTINHQLSTIIEDDTRLKDALPTVQHLLEKGANVIICGHLGRPGKKFQILNFKSQISNEARQYSLEPVAQWLSEKLGASSNKPEATTLNGFSGWRLSEVLTVLENLRFDLGEEKNDPAFAKKLAALGDIYVDDAFSAAHRNHASIVGAAQLLPHFAGLRLQKEVDELGAVLENPKRPFVVIIGGAKMETKLPVITQMAIVADNVLVGGKIAQEAKNLPQNVVVADLTPDGFDVTAESVAKFKEIIQTAKTIVWNGPLGLIKEDELDSEKGTREVATAVAQCGAYKIVGGGDTLGYIRRLGIINTFDFVSTGGGAMLDFLAGEKLPGLEALLL